MPKPFSVLIPDGESEFALFVLHCLAPFRNVTVHVLSGRRNAPTRFSRYRRSYTYVAEPDPQAPPESQAPPDSQARVHAITDLIARHRIDVLLPTETRGISLVLANREALASRVAIAPLPNATGFKVANDKWALAQFLHANQIPGPETRLFAPTPEGYEHLRALEFPVLLKPITAWGGEGIERFDDLAALRRYAEQRPPESLTGRFIVQSLRPGYVVGVNILAKDGDLLALTLQRGIIPNVHKYAAAGAIRFLKDDRFADVARRLVKALAWSGWANLDTLYDEADGQLKILEINARFWGSLRGSLVAGVSFPYLACLAALNQPFPLPDYQLARYFHPQTALREAWNGLRGKSRVEAMRWQETGLQFLLGDPLAELVRAYQQATTPPETA